MLVNCPECNSPVFVRAAAIEQRKPQRCYSCKAQLLIAEDGSVDVAVAADPNALQAKKGEGLLSATPGGPPPPKPNTPITGLPASADADPTRVLDLVAPTPEATVPGSTPPTPPVNAVFGGTVVSGEGPAPSAAASAPAPISFGDLDLGPLELEGPELPGEEVAPAATDEGEPEEGWPTMIQRSPFAATAAPPSSATAEAQAAAKELLAKEPEPTVVDAAPPAADPLPARPALEAPEDTAISDPRLPSPPGARLAAAAAMARDTQVELRGIDAATLDPSIPSGEASSDEDEDDEPPRPSDTLASLEPLVGEPLVG